MLAPARFASAQDDGPLRVTVRAGDTCERIARRVLGDADAYPRIHALNPELGPTPHHLVPGTTLLVPRPRPAAQLTSVHRLVERRPPAAAAFEPARAGNPLPRGTQVRTHEASSAEITFEDDAHVVVRERTLVIVYGGPRRLTQRRVTRAELERGALRSRLSELAGRAPLDVDTPSAQASLDGDGVVSVEEDGTSRVANHGRRAATVRAGGAVVTLPADTGTVVRQGQRPSAPRRLLAAPRWRADTTGPVLGFVGRGATLRGGFSPVRGADHYRVEVARSPRGGELLSTLELDGDAQTFEAEGLPEGVIYVSVASIDARGLEGRRSPWRAFTVRLARLVAPGGVSHEASEETPSVWPGTWLVAPRGMDCAPADGEAGASGIVTLTTFGPQRLLCGASELLVDVIEPTLTAPEAPLVRDRSVEVRIGLSPSGAPPLTVRATEGLSVSRPTVEGDEIVLRVSTPPNAASEAELTLQVAAGADTVDLGTLRLAVVDPSAAEAPVERAEPTAPAVSRRHATGALGDLLWPSLLGLRDERAGGFGAWISASVIEAPGDPQVRAAVGARAQLPETPIRIGFASQIDLWARPALAERRGEADLVASVGVLLLDDGMFGLAIDLTGFIPTRAEPESLGRVRLAPTLEASLRPTEWLALRARQGALVDATETGARLYSGALGVDLMPLDWLALGTEVALSAGDFRDLTGAAVALGVSAELRYELLEIALAGRLGLSDEARRIAGEWSTVLSLRVFAR